MIFSLLDQYFVKEAIPEFVRKLYITLETQQYQTTISWTTNNKALEIHNPENLEEQVLPKVFNQKTLNSFIRQLNLYGFRKHEKGNAKKMVFYHQFFQRNQIQDLIFIMRKRRGYHDPRKLFNIEVKQFKDRHHSFCRGVMTKIQNNIQKLKQLNPKIYEEVSKLTKQYTAKKHHTLVQDQQTKNQSSVLSSIPSIPSLSSISEVPQRTTPEIYFYPMMTSITCFVGAQMMIPMLTSFISIPDIS